MNQIENGLLKFITCGSVDDGKSTLIGHILYDSKLLYADQEQALLLDSQVGSRGGAIDYSLLLDGLIAEREQGITIDVAYRYFTTDARSFIVADTPGHEEYTRNMAVGASFADLAVILLDASQGVLEQTRRHARICNLMGIRYFVFVVNKMDLIGYDQTRFLELSQDIISLCGELDLENVEIIPVSATEGDNVTRPSESTDWYRGETLLEYLEQVNITAGKSEQGFYMPVQRVCRPDHSFRGFQGQVESGHVQVGDQLMTLPSGETAVVKSLHAADQTVRSAAIGQPVTIELDREVDVSRGCVLTKESGLKTAKSFTASLLWMDDQKLVSGRDYWIKIGTRMMPAVVAKIHNKVNVNTGLLQPADVISKNEIAECDIVLSEPAVLAEFALHRTLGELILIDRISHATAACGVIEEITREEQQKVLLKDGTIVQTIRLFDRFHYHPDTHMILRDDAKPAVYQPGDPLPLKDISWNYPSDFDLLRTDKGGYANIREGVFRGFGNREEEYPLLDWNGLKVEFGQPRNFSCYHRVMARENDYEI